jgi:uncharacterized protein YndB with AHSA1/START domain
MTRKTYQPGPAGDIQAELEGTRWTLIFVRELRHPPQRVWSALTEPRELREWAPFDSDRDLGTLGAATLTMAGGDGSEKSPAAVRRADPPVLLEYTWDDDVLRWELEPTAPGTRLTLRHTVGDKDWIPRVAAGWHICLDVADQMMAGQPLGRIVAHEAKQHGWEQLNAAYSSQLGIVNAGWPAEAGSAPRGA